MLEDIKILLRYNFKDLFAILNTEFIVYSFFISFVILLLPLINFFALIFLNFFLILSLRYLIEEVSLNKDLLEFVTSPADNINKNPFNIEKMLKTTQNQIKQIFINSLVTFFFTNIWMIIAIFLIYLFITILKTSLPFKTFIIIVIVVVLSLTLLIQIMLYIIFPLILLKQIECDITKELVYNLFYIWQDFYDENTLIFFRSLFFDLFWRFLTILIITLPVILFFFVFYKVILTNIIFAIFVGWLFFSLIIGLFLTLFAIDFVKNYYVYFHFV
ncbi:MAG: hypothetical protein ACK4GJ_02625 [bacterium]